MSSEVLKPQSFKPSPVSFLEWRDCTETTFEWADSYDTKDWDRLASILAPSIRVNYASVNDYRNDSLPAEDFVAMMSSPGFLGDPNLDTQHLMGACRMRKITPDEIEGKWQIRAAHQRYRAEGTEATKGVQGGEEKTAMTKKGKRAVLLTGHSHATITLTYKLVEGSWRFGGIETDIRWNEDGFDKMFTGFEAGQAKTEELNNGQEKIDGLVKIDDLVKVDGQEKIHEVLL